jgi:anti-sigma-K factor RskA
LKWVLCEISLRVIYKLQINNKSKKENSQLFNRDFKWDHKEASVAVVAILVDQEVEETSDPQDKEPVLQEIEEKE